MCRWRRCRALITPSAIIETGEIILAALTRDFGIAEPRLAVAGLNPHAGEDGVLGGEEEAFHRARRSQRCKAQGPST